MKTINVKELSQEPSNEHSKELPISAASSAVLYRTANDNYPCAVKAQGMYITDATGKSYLDMSGGAAVSVIGHGNSHVISRMQQQISQLDFAHTAFFTNGPQEELAERLRARFPEPGSKVYFTSGGSEAIETALKLCWQYWQCLAKPQKKIIISRQHSYHGNTFGGLSVGGNEVRRKKSAAPLIDWPRIGPCYPFRFQQVKQSLADYGRSAANELETAIITNGADNVAAFICEPVVGSSLGAVAAVPGYLQRIREICDRYEVLLILDEVMCGSGRTGTYFSFEQDDVIPDVVTLAKGIAGGYQPLAATIIRSSMVDVFAVSGFAHGHTYIGHPLACAAGCAVMDVIEQNDLLTACKQQGELMHRMLHDRFVEHPHVGEIRGRGLFCALEFVADKASSKGFAADCQLVEKIHTAIMDVGLICYPGATLVDGDYIPHILLAPPLIVEEQHLQECMNKLVEVLDRVFPVAD